MRKLIAIWLAFFAIGVLSAQEHKTGDHHHHSHGEAEMALKLNNGKKWETDKPLREGMENIRALLKANAKSFHDSKLGQSDYVKIASSIEKQTQSIFKNCKLPKEADEVLHVILFQVVENVATLKEDSSLKEKESAFYKIVDATEKYAQYFNHPGWQGIH